MNSGHANNLTVEKTQTSFMIPNNNARGSSFVSRINFRLHCSEKKSTITDHLNQLRQSLTADRDDTPKGVCNCNEKTA